MIITTQRHPFNRWLDSLLTLAGWIVFSYLLVQGLLLLLRHSMQTTGFGQIDPIFPTLATFLFYGMLLGINGLLLWGWWRWRHREMQKRYLKRCLYRQRLRASQVRLVSPLRFANEHIDVVRQNKEVVLYHSQDGAVEHVKPTTDQGSKLAEVISLHPPAPTNRPTPNTLAPARSV